MNDIKHESKQNASHTPGTRWECRFNDGIGAYDIYAVTTALNGTLSEYKVGGDLPIEDARLIASAPRLLKALEACSSLLADYDDSEGEEGDAYREAIAAIAEAKGLAA